MDTTPYFFFGEQKVGNKKKKKSEFFSWEDIVGATKGKKLFFFIYSFSQLTTPKHPKREKEHSTVKLEYKRKETF